MGGWMDGWMDGWLDGQNMTEAQTRDQSHVSIKPSDSPHFQQAPAEKKEPRQIPLQSINRLRPHQHQYFRFPASGKEYISTLSRLLCLVLHSIPGNQRANLCLPLQSELCSLTSLPASLPLVSVCERPHLMDYVSECWLPGFHQKLSCSLDLVDYCFCFHLVIINLFPTLVATWWKWQKILKFSINVFRAEDQFLDTGIRRRSCPAGVIVSPRLGQ